ncbi:putative glutamine amidotransferase [Actinomycetospora succinea]|uniref:Putative glutamine amidotransferase n=1 Tax=Actinomycetospora succinea TaxID=663603 RepID=A0A4V3D906_9PSEU|nr:gamma-glutamyl-gamma-aminobutyrate hydrolase family protein [Actinomycetospora succinea]TDQ54029.1 putative glutamine amidotransferase [Actinomycetospora succinea]
MDTPLVAVTGRRRSAAGLHTGPPAMDALEVDAYFSGYAAHVVAAGGLPLHVPGGVDAAAVMDRADALLLTGGNDVDPARYGAVPDAHTSALEPARDALEIALLAAARERGRPVLAICRGIQLVNVAWGGTLYRHLPEHADTRWHDVALSPDSVLAGLHGAGARVNSLHHQGVDRVGDGLVVTATAPDGQVEGLEAERLVAVQWHPEQLDDVPQPEFRWLVDAC